MNIVSNFVDFYDYCFYDKNTVRFNRHDELIKTDIKLSINQIDIIKSMLSSLINKEWVSGLDETSKENLNYFLEKSNIIYYRNYFVPFILKINHHYYFGYKENSNFDDVCIKHPFKEKINYDGEFIFSQPIYTDYDDKFNFNINDDYDIIDIPLAIFCLNNNGLSNFISHFKYQLSLSSELSVNYVLINFSFSNSGNVPFFNDFVFRDSLNHYKLYVEIESYLTRNINKKMINISNNSKIEKAGFSLKESFRK